MSTLIEHLRAGALYEEYGDVKEAVEELERQAKEIEKLKADAERLIWLEQRHWGIDELYNLVNNWITKDGKRHSQGLASAIDAAIAQQKETP